jgi:methyl-accepting chemotaxis protein
MAGLLLIVTITTGRVAKRLVCEPYVSTVVRMEGLAAGDVTSEIAYTQHSDCVGRMTKAMAVFRANAVAIAQAGEAQAAVVSSLSGGLDQLASGTLTCRIEQPFPSEYEGLRGNFSAAVDAMLESISSVAQSASGIRTGSGEIRQASDDLARRTEGSAASIEETSAAIAQMDARLKATAQAATRTVTRADQTISTVTGGRTVADEAVQAMGRVSESAKGIDSVIAGLDKIAFQTRVLAMNAAVEAGRASDAGRGFAVVADLVSALAMRAEEEAKCARDQLTTTQADIVTAVQAVERVDGALADISSDVDEVHKLLNTIAEDNQAQATAITEINAAIGSMDQTTQQNAAMVEQTSAAARNLATEAEELARQVGRFSTGEARETRGRPPKRDAKEKVSVSPRPGAVAGPGGNAVAATADAGWSSF